MLTYFQNARISVKCCIQLALMYEFPQGLIENICGTFIMKNAVQGKGNKN